MTNKTEQISALLDGELDDAAIDALLASDTLQDEWETFHLMRDVMQGEIGDAPIDTGFADRVAAAIAEEPTVVAPQLTRQRQRSQAAATVVPLFRKLGQYAIAATVAAVTVVGVSQYGGEQDEALQPSFVTQPLSGNLVPVSVSANTPTYTAPATEKQRLQREQLRLQKQIKAHNQRINAYLQDHQFQLSTYQQQSNDNENTHQDPEANNP